MPPSSFFRRSAFLFCLAALFLGHLPVLPIWLGGHPILLNDMFVAYYAYFEDFHRNWSWSNPIPLWSSSYQGGMPMHAYWQSAYLYPMTWILFGPFSPLHTIYLFYGLHFALAIAGFLLLGPRLGLHRLASFWSGLAFGLSGTMLARYEHPTFLAGWAYLPLVLGLFLRLQGAPNKQGVAWLGLALALQTLGGHPQATAATAILLGLFFLRGLFSRIAWPSKLAPAASGLLALLLCLPLFLPFLDLLGQTERYDGAAWEGKAEAGSKAGDKLSEGVFGFQKFATGGLRPLHAASLALPRALGTPAHASWWGGEAWGEVFLFIGSAGLLMGFFASPRRATGNLRWLWICGLIGLWLAMGTHLFASHILYHLPGLNNFRRPARWGILFVLALAAWSGHGFQRWAGSPRRRLWPAWLAGCGVAGMLASVLLSQWPEFRETLFRLAAQFKSLDPSKDYSAKLLTLARDLRWDFAFFAASAGLIALRHGWKVRRLTAPLIFLLALDLLRIHWSHFFHFPAEFYREPPRTLQAMDLSTKPFWRVDTYLEYPGTEMWEMHHDPLRRVDLFEREKLALSYGVHAVFGIKHVGAHLPLLWPWDKALTPGGKSARYLASNVEMDHYKGSGLRRLLQVDSVRVYEVLDWKPRLDLLRRDSNPANAESTCPAGFARHGALCVSEPRDGLLKVTGDFRSGDTLVFREHWHKGWRARADHGKWQSPVRYAGAFMAVEFRESAREAEWRF